MTTAVSECTTDWERIARLRAVAITTGQHIGYQDAPRREALALRGARGDSPVLHRSLGMVEMFARINVLISDDDLLAGAFSPAPPSGWEEEQREFPAQQAVPALAHTPEVEAGLAELRQACGQGSWFGNVGQGHSNVDFAQVLRCGLAAMAQEAETAAEEQSDPARATASRAMAAVLRGVMTFAARHADLAEAQAAQSSPARAAELCRIAESCRRVPGQPAETFFDALQAVWLVYLATGMSESPSANSLGCADRYLYPYYAHDLAAGRLTEIDAEELLAHFLLKCACYAEGQSLTLGGQLADGTDAVNDLTRLFFRLIPRLNLPEPIISVRIHDHMRAEDLDAVVAITAAGGGQPSYYAEARCRAMLSGRGVPAVDLARLAINSCMGVVVAGSEVSDMWGGIIGLPVCLELAVSRGVTADGAVLPTFAALCPETYASLEDVFAAYERILRHVAALVVEKNRQETAYQAQWHPNPLLSALLDDCRTRGLDRLAGGPRYHSVIIEAFGWANVSDSLAAIQELVFRHGACGLEELLAAARADWAGRDDLLLAARACAKYGNDSPEADALAVRVLDSFISAVTDQRRPGEHAEYLPSLHSLNHNVHGGRWAPVSLEGRRYGAPLNKQLGPSVWAALAGPTAILNSAAKLPTDALPGGQALDLTLPPTLLTTRAGRAQFSALLRAYFALGGADLQVNTVTPADLRSAMAHPEQYRHLLIRVAGYSEYFVKLDRATQEDLVTRVAAGL